MLFMILRKYLILRRPRSDRLEGRTAFAQRILRGDIDQERGRADGGAVAEGVVARPEELAERDPMPAPFVVKPVNQGSSVGVRIVRINDNSWREEVTEWCFGSEVLVERFVPGRELTVAVMGDQALGVCEIVPRGTFYDYPAKNAAGGAGPLVPSPGPAAPY